MTAALWPERWPLIALQECIDKIEEAPDDKKSMVRWNLPCAECPKQTACLNAKRKELGPLMYDREIMTRPRSSESSLFPRELFEKGIMHDEQLIPYYEKPFGLEHRYAVASAWDLAWSEKIGGDWLVKITALLDRKTGKRKIIDIWRGQKLSFSEQVDLIVAEHGKYRDDLVVIESDASQRIWSQYIGGTTSVPVIPHTAGGKRDLAMGVPSLIMQLEAGQWEFPFQIGTFHRENMEVFFAEAEAFGWVDGKLQGVGEHDDTVMAWWHLSWAMNMLTTEKRQQHRNVQQGRYI